MTRYVIALTGMILAALSLLIIVGAAHAVVICNGDSNTQSDWQGFPNGTADGWCEQMGGINRGVGGLTISDTGISYGAIPLWGGYYIDAEVAGTDPFLFVSGAPVFLGQTTYAVFPYVDTYILAFGTNDIQNTANTPTQIIQAYKKYREHILAAGSVVYVATTPPMFNADCTLAGDDALIRSLNRKIRRNWPTRFVEFYEGFSCEDFAADGVHLTAAGQAKRAAAAALGL